MQRCLDKRKMYQCKVIGENETYRVRIVTILERTVVVETTDGVTKLALARKSELKEIA
ncbi:hypothetical protein [Enterococcus mundtii]|uniref:hypothetical protein n=1 Tax=Enterococcus mundtii TaxID=53346 RepID=UPI0015C30D1F|nr:hypothetical protein [Enterococcus mundtii]